ncbi:hypothetical protein ACOMHN_035811 [Nucella lapillus]
MKLYVEEKACHTGHFPAGLTVSKEIKKRPEGGGRREEGGRKEGERREEGGRKEGGRREEGGRKEGGRREEGKREEGGRDVKGN